MLSKLTYQEKAEDKSKPEDSKASDKDNMEIEIVDERQKLTETVKYLSHLQR